MANIWLAVFCIVVTLHLKKQQLPSLPSRRSVPSSLSTGVQLGGSQRLWINCVILVDALIPASSSVFAMSLQLWFLVVILRKSHVVFACCPSEISISRMANYDSLPS